MQFWVYVQDGSQKSAINSNQIRTKLKCSCLRNANVFDELTPFAFPLHFTPARCALTVCRTSERGGPSAADVPRQPQARAHHLTRFARTRANTKGHNWTVGKPAGGRRSVLGACGDVEPLGSARLSPPLLRHAAAATACNHSRFWFCFACAYANVCIECGGCVTLDMHNVSHRPLRKTRPRSI